MLRGLRLLTAASWSLPVRCRTARRHTSHGASGSGAVSATTGEPIVGAEAASSGVAAAAGVSGGGGGGATSSNGDAVAGRLTGKVRGWHPFDRKGIVVEEETGREYVIADARAFETVLPTLLRSLDGATVTFVPSEERSSDRVIVRMRTDEINESSYRRRPPVDFYNPFAANASDRLAPRAGSDKDDGEGASPDAVRYAKEIVVDLSSLTSDKLARVTGPLVAEDAIQPTTNLKDMRSSRIFDRHTNEYLQLARALGSSEAAEKEMARRAEEAARNAVRREVVAEGVEGVIVAWSAIHRSGVVLEGVTEIDASAPVDTTTLKNASIIRNVFSFQSALPTSQNLLHRRVRFTKTTYSTQGSKTFAEEIVVAGDLSHDASAAPIEEARRRKEHEKLMEKRERQLGVYAAREMEREQARRIMAGEDTTTTAAEAEAEAVPEGPVYGVITRWSGGQGTVESGDGKMYYVQSAADFVQLVEKDSHVVRGAVVTFVVDAAKPRYATDINILSTATSSVAEMRPLLDRVPGSSTRRRREAAEGGDDDSAAAGVSGVAHATVVEVNELTGKKVPRSVELEPEGVDWIEGTLLSWSPHEDQGIIVATDCGTRYVLRDADENVIQYAARKPLFQKGRKVKFTAFGTSGLLACNVVALATEADEEELRSAELRPREPKLTMDGNMEEAIASPLSTNYWISRMTKSGFDVADVKKMQNKAITLDEFDDEGDDPDSKKLLDSEEVMKQDEWWRDPRKNKRFPNSEMTAGHLALMGPASMLNTALKASNPKTLNKMVNKYQSRLTEEQKEMAWEKAKEMAPKYEEQVKKARETNEEPTFYFF